MFDLSCLANKISPENAHHTDAEFSAQKTFGGRTPLEDLGDTA